MNAVLLLIPAAGGYWLLSHSNVIRYRFARLTGYHLLLGSALCGIVLYGVAHALLLAFKAYFPAEIGVWTNNSPDILPNTVQVSLFLSFVVTFLLNFLWSKEECAVNAMAEFGDLVEQTIHDAADHHRLIEVSLRSRKAYVGIPLEGTPGSIPDSDVVLVPLYSGYRNESTLELILTRGYRSVVLLHTLPFNPYSDWVWSDFRVVVPMSEVVSVRLFKEDAFDDLQIVGPLEQPSSNQR